MVAPLVAAAGISAGASLLGGLFGKKSSDRNVDYQREANEANLAWAREQQQRNEDLQREFAQQGIRWKVSDAKAAGLHPLYAIGANTTSYQPIAIGAGQSAPQESDWAGSTLRSMGQDVSRAIAAQQTAQEREASRLQLELLRAQVAKEYALAEEIHSRARSSYATSAMIGPPMSMGPPIQVRELGPIPQSSGSGSGESHAWKFKPQEVPTSRKGQPAFLPRNIPGYVGTLQPDGTTLYMPAQGDQRMDEISVLDVLPWARANIGEDNRFIARYLFGRELADQVIDSVSRGMEWFAPDSSRRNWRAPQFKPLWRK